MSKEFNERLERFVDRAQMIEPSLSKTQFIEVQKVVETHYRTLNDFVRSKFKELERIQAETKETNREDMRELFNKINKLSQDFSVFEIKNNFRFNWMNALWILIGSATPGIIGIIIWYISNQ
jgi:hypothetical protein